MKKNLPVWLHTYNPRTGLEAERQKGGEDMCAAGLTPVQCKTLSWDEVESDREGTLRLPLRPHVHTHKYLKTKLKHSTAHHAFGILRHQWEVELN